MGPPRLVEDDCAERLVGDVELVDVDFADVEPEAAPARRRHPGRRSCTPWRRPGSARWRASTPTRTPSTGSIGQGRPEMTASSSAAPAAVRASGPTWSSVGESSNTPSTGHEPVRRLQSDDAAVRGRDADRAARVGAQGEVAHAGADERRRAARRTARRPAGVPRVERHAVGRVDAPAAYSSRLVLQKRSAPAARSLLTTSASSRGRRRHAHRRGVRRHEAPHVHVVLDRDRHARGAARAAARSGASTTSITAFSGRPRRSRRS